MPKIRMITFFAGVALVIAALSLGGCASTGSAVPAETFAQNIVYEIAPSAALTNVAFGIKPYKGTDHLHLALTVKNISSETKRFRVNIFLPDGTSGGGLYPRKVKGDVTGVKAGEEHTREFPMLSKQLPSGFTIIVKELG